MAENFVGVNQRTLAAEMNSRNSDVEFYKNKKGHIFAIFTGDGTQAAVSKNAETALAEGAELADLSICDMPGKDAETGMPNGSTFLLITCRNRENCIKSFKR